MKMKDITFLTHKGVRILYEDLENAQLEEVIPWIERNKESFAVSLKNPFLPCLMSKMQNLTQR